MKFGSKLTKAGIDILVNYFLNVYAKVDDPVGALAHYLDGDFIQAERWLNAWQRLARGDSNRFRKAHGPEFGDVTLREWIRESFTPVTVRVLSPERVEVIADFLLNSEVEAKDDLILNLWRETHQLLVRDEISKFKLTTSGENDDAALIAWILDEAAVNPALR